MQNPPKPELYQKRTVLVSKMNYDPGILHLTTCKSLVSYSGMSLNKYDWNFLMCVFLPVSLYREIFKKMFKNL